MSENSERAKQRRIAARELQWLESRMPRTDRTYKAAIRAACRQYERWLENEAENRVRRRLKGLKVQERKKRRAA